LTDKLGPKGKKEEYLQRKTKKKKLVRIRKLSREQARRSSRVLKSNREEIKWEFLKKNSKKEGGSEQGKESRWYEEEGIRKIW